MSGQNEPFLQSRPRQLICCKCGSTDRKYVELECQHIFCIMCAAFMFIKSRASVTKETEIRCFKCNVVSQLDSMFIDIINTTLKEEVIPSLDPTESFTGEHKILQRNYEKSHYIETIDRKIKSQEHSFQNITPSTAKYFFSKCESPSSKKKKDLKKFCKHHTLDEVTYLCLTCEAEMLCVKCISANKKHSSHEVKGLTKGIEILKEGLNETKFSITYKIDQMQLIQKRIDDKSILLKDKAIKTVSNIKYEFNELSRKLKEKENQIILACEYHFQNLQKNFNLQQEKVSYCIDLLTNQKQKLINTEREKDQFEFLDKYKQISKINEKLLLNSQPYIPLEKLACPSNSIYRQISNLSQKILSLQIEYKQSNLGHVDIENCRSQSKIRRDKSYKRVRTNLGSLNSSREKKDKKYTKTEEDEKRMKNEKIINYRNDKRASGKIPAYISDFINKKGTKCGSGGSSYVLEMTSVNMQNSKPGKMSKTIAPQEVRKKKEHTAVIKERIERRTVHHNFRSQKTGQSTKKKRKD